MSETKEIALDLILRVNTFFNTEYPLYLQQKRAKKIKEAEEKYTKTLPTDYIELAEQGRHKEARAAIWKHVGKVKQYDI